VPTRSAHAFARRYGPWAVVAGASEGIGAAFARELAARGLHVALAARRPGPLGELASSLPRAAGAEVRTVVCDLGEAAGIDALLDATRGLEVGLLVYNAASSAVGPFLDTPLDAHRRAVDVNANGAVALAHALAAPMAARGHGGVILMSSLTAFQGTPLVASYGATKAFNLALAEALWHELKPSGVDVLACCAGATLTPGYARVTPRRTASFFAPRPQAAGQVVREALRALGRRPFVVTGRGNRVAAFVMSRLLSRRRAVTTIGRAMEARYGK